MRSKEFYPFIRGKPNPLIYIKNRRRDITPSGKLTKAEIFIRGWPLMVGDHLPRGKPQESKNRFRSQRIREWLIRTFFKKCRSDIPGSREIFRKGGIQVYLLT